MFTIGLPKREVKKHNSPQLLPHTTIFFEFEREVMTYSIGCGLLRVLMHTTSRD